MAKNKLVYGIIIFLALIAVMWLWFSTTRPKQSAIDAATGKISSINVNVLDSASSKKIMQMDVNGAVPVTLSAQDLGRDNPFSNY